MKALFLTIYIAMAMSLLIALVMLAGCAPFLAAKEAKDMTPEQIKAYGEQGMDVYQCINIAGPPPMGGVTVLVVPKHAKAEVMFSSNCQLMKGSVTP